jgi:hypothetical protein
VSDTQLKVPTVEEIELRAYEIYLKRGDGDGVALEDWLAAERELLASRPTELSDPTLPIAGERVVAWLVVRRHRLTEMLQAHVLMFFLTSL